MNDIFKNTYFGKAYRTRDGRKAKFVCKNPVIHMYIDGMKEFTCYNKDGTFSEKPHSNDIVAEWKEPVDKKELDIFTEKIYKIIQDSRIAYKKLSQNKT